MRLTPLRSNVEEDAASNIFEFVLYPNRIVEAMETHFQFFHFDRLPSFFPLTMLLTFIFFTQIHLSLTVNSNLLNFTGATFP
jgi:hypothetical protein